MTLARKLRGQCALARDTFRARSPCSITCTCIDLERLALHSFELGHYQTRVSFIFDRAFIQSLVRLPVQLTDSCCFGSLPNAFFPLVQSFICLTPRTVGQSLGLHQAGYITPLSVALLGLSRSFNRNLPKKFPLFGAFWTLEFLPN